jgi:hypothetical protein
MRPKAANCLGVISTFCIRNTLDLEAFVILPSRAVWAAPREEARACETSRGGVFVSGLGAAFCSVSFVILRFAGLLKIRDEQPHLRGI